METPQEKHYRIANEDYFVKLIQKKTIDYENKKFFSFSEQLSLMLSETQQYISKKGKVEYQNNLNEKKLTGKFEEAWRDFSSGDSYHSLTIELNDKPKKRIEISELDSDDGNSTVNKKALEKKSRIIF